PDHVRSGGAVRQRHRVPRHADRLAPAPRGAPPVRREGLRARQRRSLLLVGLGRRPVVRAGEHARAVARARRAAGELGAGEGEDVAMSTNTRRPCALLVAGLLLGGCEELTRRMDLARMIDQPRLDAFEPVPYGVDPDAVRVPVEGTVPREAELGAVDLALQEIPVPVDEELLHLG